VYEMVYIYSDPMFVHIPTMNIHRYDTTVPFREIETGK